MLELDSGDFGEIFLRAFVDERHREHISDFILESLDGSFTLNVIIFDWIDQFVFFSKRMHGLL